jgi:hypothetical protein
MKTLFRILIIIILIINGLGALVGGYQLMRQPDGSLLQMSLDLLEGTPFVNFFIPGLILFIFNGLMSVVTLFLTELKHRLHPWFIIAQGAILMGWIIIQLILIKTFYPPMHITFILFGTLLILLGINTLRKA